MNLRFALIAVALLAFPATGRADTPRAHWGVTAGFERFFGETGYQIGGRFSDSDGAGGVARFPVSELIFPLGVWMASLDLECMAADRVYIHLGGMVNLSGYDKAGTMKDSDWLTGGGTPDIYSESDARLRAGLAASDLQYVVFRRRFFSLGVGAGFNFRYFDYVIENLRQSYPEDPTQIPVRLHGTVLTYTAAYYLPRLCVTPAFLVKERWYLRLLAGFTPAAIGRDRDDHLVRYKESRSKTIGIGFDLSCGGEYRFPFGLTLGITGSFEMVRATGEQRQYYYRNSVDSGGNPIPKGYTVRVESLMRLIAGSVGVSLGYRW